MINAKYMTKLSSLLKKEAVDMQALEPLFFALRKAKKYGMRSYRINQVEDAYNDSEQDLEDSRIQFYENLLNGDPQNGNEDLRPIPY